MTCNYKLSAMPCKEFRVFISWRPRFIFFMLMYKLVVETSRCRDILIRLMLNHEFWLCLNKIYLISPYGSETFLNDPPSLAVTFLQKRHPSPPPPFILCWWRLISPRAPESNVFPPKKKNLPSLNDPKRKESNLFSSCFLRLTFFHATWVHWNSAYADFFIFLLPFQFTKNYLLSLNFTRSHFDQARILLVNHMAF